MRKAILVGCLSAVIAAGLQAAETGAPARSGEPGERWKSESRLPDFSYAGYRRGRPIPAVPQMANVKDFGAVGDGEADDTKAIQAAIDATEQGAVFLPPGRYRVTDHIWLKKPGVVLRGAGPARTTLWFPLGLDEIHPREMRDSRGIPTSGYSFDGAFLSLHGDYRARRLAQIVAVAKRGDREILVSHTEGLRVGQDVLLRVREDASQTLKTFLYSGDPGDIRKGKQLDTKMVVRITAVEGARVAFDRPLRFETRPEWQPEVCAFEPAVTEAGIEGIRFEFPPRKYGGHFKENGANAIEMLNVAHCWVRDVAIHNGDMGASILGCHNTLDGIVFTADRARETEDGWVKDCTGHHAFQFKRAEDNVVTRFDLRTCYVHDLSVEHASGNVYSNGRGRDLNFDHHKDTPYENLYTALDCGRGTRIWQSGGGASLGRACAGWGTFWNIRAERPLEPPPAEWGPSTMTFVGMRSPAPSSTDPSGPWWESGDVAPENLHQTQRERRSENDR